MPRTAPLLTALLLGLAAIAPGAGALQAQDDGGGEGGGGDVPQCVDYWGEARYGAYGYDHVVHVRNGCERLAHCKVWTNVNRDKQSVDVPAGEEEQVVTYIGSPAREFEAHARCTLED